MKGKKWPENPKSLDEIWYLLPEPVKDFVFLGKEEVKFRLQWANNEPWRRSYDFLIKKYGHLFTFFTKKAWPENPKTYSEIQDLLPNPVIDFIYCGQEVAKEIQKAKKKRWRIEYDILIKKYGYLFPLVTRNVFRGRNEQVRTCKPKVRRNRREYKFYSLNK